MNSTRYNQRGLPPQYPRRSSNTPISSLALNSVSATPNRSRSLDGLLDTEPKLAAQCVTDDATDPSETTKSCDEFEKNFEEDDNANLSKKAQSLDNNLDCSLDSSDMDKSSLYSNSSDSKRKRNFMDRCVNKVRSLIKK